ncbi:hypothetical protein DMW00_24725 [Vibrio parahaemolyticus]|nr:hypothetical protein [Vibrio parahaemolyticus]EGR2813161.1 hypothetical protein [Vibrio parahaemolyticus]EGR3228405.1 hypothetical protein [Vibrio parahaemolyticus]
MNVVLSPSFKSSLSCNHQTGTCLGFVRTSVDKIHITKHSRGIHNARQFWFELALVFTAQWFRLGGGVVHPLMRR